MIYKLKYKPYGANSILIEWPAEIEKSILTNILLFKTKIQNFNNKQITGVTHAYNSVLVSYSNLGLHYNDEVSLLKSIYNSEEVSQKQTLRLWKIPVCYHEDFGLDLQSLSEVKNISTEALIKRHFQVTYLVYFIGFLPGFLYLGGLDETLITPRKATPRLKVKKGAVGIGGNQTGIYPIESPGGWNIIGNSPIAFFNTENNPPCFAKAGDSIQFYPIGLKEYQAIKTLVDANNFQIESEVLDG